MFTIKSLVSMCWPGALVWFYWFDWVTRCCVWFSWVSVLFTCVDSGSSMSCMSWLNVLSRLADCLSWPSACYECVDQLFEMIEFSWTHWQSMSYDWVDLDLLTKYVVWLAWPEGVNKVGDDIERLPFPDQPLIMVASLCPGKPSA